MIRAVLDANVIVSCFPATKGTLVELRRHFQVNSFTLVTSDFILGEVRSAWQEPYWAARLSTDVIAETFELIDELAEKVDPRTPMMRVATHSEDDLVLAAAVGAKVDFLVSGDHGLLGIGAYAGVRLITCSQFVELLDRR